MIPQGTIPFPPQQIDSLIRQINAVDTAAELQITINVGMPSLQAQIDAVKSQAATYAPLIALVALSITDLPSVITFLKRLVSDLLAPYVLPYEVLLAQIAAYPAKLAELAAAITAAEQRIEHTVIVPVITV